MLCSKKWEREREKKLVSRNAPHIFLSWHPPSSLQMMSAPTHSHSLYIYAYFNEEQQTTNVKFHGIFCSSMKFLLKHFPPPTYTPHQLLSRANHKKNFFFPFTLLLSSFLTAHRTHPSHVASSKSKTRNMNRTTKTFSHKHESALMYKSKRKPLNKTYFCLTNNTRVKAIVEKELFTLNT